MNIEGAAALVTGGASGLGLATATRLAAAGAKVTIVDLPSAPGAEQAAAIGGTFAPADVTDEAQVGAALDAAAEHGPIRVVVNCAGIGNAVAPAPGLTGSIRREVMSLVLPSAIGSGALVYRNAQQSNETFLSVHECRRNEERPPLRTRQRGSHYGGGRSGYLP